jgi:ADP-heptose:LPS heptosyltransferase
VSDSTAQHEIPAEWRAARRILAVRLDNLGDVLVTSPAIRAVRHAIPEASITLLASPAGAQAARLNPDIDDVIVYQAPWMDPWQRLLQDLERERRVAEELRGRGFDAAVIFTALRQSPMASAYLCYTAGIPLRLGAAGGGLGSLLTHTYRHQPPEDMRHEVLRCLDLVGAVGMANPEPDLVLAPPAEARASLEQRLVSVGLPALTAHGSWLTAPLVVLHPGCSMAARTYPAELFARAADLLVERLGATVAITGSEEERPLAERVRSAMRRPAHALAGALSFAELCALIDAADLVLTNNTGPMHIAAARKTPVAVPFALTNQPSQWHPWRVPHRLLYHEVPCRICYSKECPTDHACLLRVDPEQVAAAAEELLAGATDDRRRATDEAFPERPLLYAPGLDAAVGSRRS